MKNSFLLILVVLNIFISVVFTKGNANIPALICGFTESAFTFVGGKTEVAKINGHYPSFLPGFSLSSCYPISVSKKVY